MSRRRERQEEDDDYEEAESSKSESQSSESGSSSDEQDAGSVSESSSVDIDLVAEEVDAQPVEPAVLPPRKVIVIDDAEEPDHPRRVGRNQPLVQAIVPRRGPARGGRESYVEAFRRLQNDDLDGFLTHWIIHRDFAPAFDLLKNFGQGHRQATVTAFWHLHWRGSLFCRKLSFARIRGSCCACALRRNLKYCFYLRTAVPDEEFFNAIDDQADGGIDLMGLMGTHCFEIKFRALMALADICLGLLDDINRPDFNTFAPATFSKALERVRQAPALMKQTYD